MFEQLKKMFIQEVSELLDKIEQALLQLENNPSDQELVKEIFRHLHTIKGAAGMYGFDKTVELAHLTEELFRNIKEKKINVSEKIINLSFTIRDLLEQLIKSDEQQWDEQKFNTIKQDLIQLTGKQIETPTPQTPKPQQTLATYYILFEPKNDIYQRGVNLTAIVEDLHKLKNIIITPFDDDQRKDRGLLPIFWEIIWAGKDLQTIKNIFLFTPEEVKIHKLCNCNLLENPEFRKFYQSLGKNFTTERIEQVRQFVQKHNLPTQEPPSRPKAEKLQPAQQAKTEQSEQFQSINYIRVPAQQLDNLLSLVSQLIIHNSQLSVAIDQRNWEQLNEISEKFQTLINAIKDNTLQLRLVPIKMLFTQYQRLIRDLSKAQGKKIRFVTDGGDTLIDKSIVERLYTPLMHVIRNAVDHGIEPVEERIKAGKDPVGTIRLIAFQSNINVIIQIQDDGRGIDPELIKAKAVELGLVKYADNLSLDDIYEIIFTPGFTTAQQISKVSGRGMGMDAIRQAIRELRGNVEIDSEKGLGTSITIKLPATLSIIDSLHVSTNNFHFLLPLSNILICQKTNPKELRTFSGSQIIFNDEPIPFVDIRKLFNLGGEQQPEENIIIFDLGTQKLAMMFEKIHGEVSAVVKTMGHLFYALEFFLGASILGDGSIAYIIDPYKIIKGLSKITIS